MKKCSEVRILILSLILLLSVQGISNDASAFPVDKLTLEREIQHRKQSPSFSELVNYWEGHYGKDALQPLLKIASNKKNEDTDRYIALMGAAKVGGHASGPLIYPFLKDTSWMMRSGAIHILQFFQPAHFNSLIFPLLKDPAWLVRSEAIDAITSVRPQGTEQALISILDDPSNYLNGKFQGPSKRALLALGTLNCRGAIPKIRKLSQTLKTSEDRELAYRALKKLER